MSDSDVAQFPPALGSGPSDWVLLWAPVGGSQHDDMHHVCALRACTAVTKPTEAQPSAQVRLKNRVGDYEILQIELMKYLAKTLPEGSFQVDTLCINPRNLVFTLTMFEDFESETKEQT